MPEIIQVNISRGGIPKRAVREVMINLRGLEGDAFAHPHLHGGPRQEVLIIASEVVDELAARGFPVVYGSLGENLTIRGVAVESLGAGQMWRAGNAILELTKFRKPCSTLDVLQHPSGQKIQSEIAAARAGFYASVRRAGLVSPGAPFELLEALA